VVQNGVTDKTLIGFTRRWSIHELLLFFVIVPFLMVVIYFLPVSLKQSYFILYSDNANIYSLFLSNFTHSEPLHIIGNMIVYLVVMFLLFNIETDKRIFRVMMALIFLVLPWLLSWITLSLIKNLPPSQGVSGVVAALLGYLPFSIYRYVKKNYKVNLSIFFLFFVFIANGSLVIANLTGFSAFTVVLIIFAVCLGILNIKGVAMIAKELKHRMQLIQRLNVSKSRQDWIFFYRFIITCLLLTLMFSLFMIIPQNPIEGSMIINSLAHYIGYVFGLLVPVNIEVIFQLIKIQ